MTVDRVGYHAPTVLAEEGEADDWAEQHGETALRWAGTGVTDFGLTVGCPVSMSAYEALFASDGARHPSTGERLVVTTRTDRPIQPGDELVNHAPKSVAVLSACNRTRHAVAILEADTAAQLAHLDLAVVQHGGRRGKAGRIRCATHGLTMAITRHLTSRAGDPYLHHHVLIANVLTLEGGHGTRALDTRALSWHLKGAAKDGRDAAKAMAADLGYQTEDVRDQRGAVTQWRIAGVPPELEDLFSKRTAQMAAAAAAVRAEGKQASRRVLVAATRPGNGPKCPDMAALAVRWRDEMTAVGWPPEGVLEAVDRAAQGQGAA